ncbi:MAG: DUF378 domain-containing protein [Eubacteriaceae bacterium]
MLHKAAFILILIGALNWGLVGIFQFDLVSFIFGSMTLLSRIVYTLIGLSGILTLLKLLSKEI